MFSKHAERNVLELTLCSVHEHTYAFCETFFSACLCEWFSSHQNYGNHLPESVWSQISLPEKLVVIQLVEKLHALNGTVRFIMPFTYTPKQPILRQFNIFPPPHTTIPLRSSLMLSSSLRIGVTSDYVHSVSPAKILYEFRLSHAVGGAPIFSPVIWSED